MFNKDNYKVLKEKYGHLTSWDIWEMPNLAIERMSARVDDMTSFEDENAFLSLIHNKYVFFALNGSIAHLNGQSFNNLKNFHSSYKFQKDYKLRAALYQTPYWGSYISDVIKNYPTIGRNELMRDLKRDPALLEENKKFIMEELQLIGGNPTFIAIGGDSYQLLNGMFPEITIKQIPHYAIYFSCEDYVKMVHKKLI
jgi:hypothetical protein